MSNLNKDTSFETFVVGSLPRPQWVKDLIDDRKNNLINKLDAKLLLDQAVPSAIKMQERAGVDYISDGEWRRESYVKVFADSVSGFEKGLISDPTGVSGLEYPAIVSNMKKIDDIAVSESVFLKNITQSKTIIALPAPYTIGRRMWSPEHSSSAYETSDDFVQACIPIIREEIKNLIDIGVDAIQLDEPWLALLVDPDYRKRSNISGSQIDHEIQLSIQSINSVVEGLEKIPFSIHLCHAHYNRKHGTKGPYDLIIDALSDINVDRFAMEFATPDAGGLEVLSKFPKNKTIGLGVIDHTDINIETPEIVVNRVEKAMEYIDKSHITLNPDCGFAPSSQNPMDFDEAYKKLRSMSEGSKLLRAKYE